MPRHILDKERVRDDGHRVREFARIERAEVDTFRSPAVQAMHRARPAPKGIMRNREFLKLDRRRGH